MVKPHTYDRFLIDGRFIVNRVHDAFLGAPLLTVDGADHTCTFGFARDLLHLRQTLGIHVGAVVIANDPRFEAAKYNIDGILTFLDRFKIPYVHDSANSGLSVVESVSSRFTHIVTADRSVLQLSRKGLVIVLADARRRREYESYSKETVQAKMGVEPTNIPTYLALTTVAKKAAVTHRQAVRLVELYGDLDAIYENISSITGPIRRKLEENENDVRQRYLQNQVGRALDPRAYEFKRLSINLDTKRHRQVLANYGFHSLLPALIQPSRVQLSVGKSEYQNLACKAVVNRESIKAFESDIASVGQCAIDTESDDKDPRTAQLLGVSFCFKEGTAYFVPLIESDLEDVTRDDLLASLRRVLQGNMEWIGHNIKYDYVLLRTHGLQMDSVHFDTMLAANECHGDLDSYRLKALSDVFLGRKITAYHDLVGNDCTFFDLPFKDLVSHACEDAEVTFQLHRLFASRLKKQGLEDQFACDTMARLRSVCDWEFSGIPIDEAKANEIRESMLKQAVHRKDAISREIGNVGDIDSPKDLAAMLTTNLGLKRVAGKGKVTVATLEQIAITEPNVRLVVEYKRLRQQIKAIESILSATRNNRVYPVFNPVGSPSGVATTSRPKLFEINGIPRLKSCFPKSIKGYFKDVQKELDTLSNVTQDRTLTADRTKRSRKNKFMAAHPLLKDVPHDELLWCLVVGESDASVGNKFFLDRLSVSTVRHDVEKRYEAAFEWLRSFQREAAECGYARVGSKQKHLDGLKSANVAKRRDSLRHVVRWLLRS